MSEKVAAPWDGTGVDPAAELKIQEGLKKLRAQFDERAIGKLPRASRPDAKPGKCNECGGWHKLPAIHLDYVGHAEVTDRLLSVDPRWNWEPLSTDENGLPRFIRASGGNPLGLWIKLTVLGVTRLGYGSVEPGAFDAEKQLIGDALRNAAMRFGVALDLWSKAELESTLEVSEVVSTKTGEITEKAGVSPPSIPSREQAEIDAFATGGLPTPTRKRSVLGIPILTDTPWSVVETMPLGGRSKYAHLTLGAMIDENADDGRLEFLERDAKLAIERKWDAIPLAKKHLGVGLASELVLLAYDELQNRRSAPPTFVPDEEVKA